MTILYKLAGQFNAEIKSISIEMNVEFHRISSPLHSSSTTPPAQVIKSREGEGGKKVWRDGTGVSEGLGSETG